MKFQAGIILGLLAFSIITPYVHAETKLWDLQIQIHVENIVLLEGDMPIISGRVTDQASNPVANAQVRVLVGAESQFTSTDENGDFKVAMVEFSGVPGVHIINVMVTAEDGRMGIDSGNFQVRGEISPSTVTQKRLSTQEAIKYLNSTRDEHANNPIGIRLFDYYQNLNQKLLSEKQLEKTLKQYDESMNEKRSITDESLLAAIEAKKPGSGYIKGRQFNEMLGKIDSERQGIISNQLNYTANNFIEAKMIRDQILNSGGSVEEARKAYFEKLAMPRSMMESMTVIQIPIIENYTDTNSTLIDSVANPNSTNIETSNISYHAINGTSINLGLDGSTIVLNINGTLIKFMINGTQLVQITNSTN